ncbi:MAG: DUF4329 domain-containing protein [bacterium]
MFKYLFSSSIAGTFAIIFSVYSPSVWAIGTVNYLAFDQQRQDTGLWFELKPDNDKDWLTQFSEPTPELARSSLLIDQVFPDYTLHWGMATSEQQSMNQLGVSYSNISVYGFTGSGDTTSTIFSPYDRVDKFHFHGGLRQNYEYSGFHLGYGSTRLGNIAVTHASISATGLNNRSVSELSWRGKRLQLSMMQVEESNRYAGKVYSAGVALKRHQITLNHLAADNQAEYTGMSFEGRTKNGKDWGIHLDHRSNPLYQDANESRMTFTLGFSLGTVPRMNATQTEAEAAEQEKQKGKNTGLLIGAGAIGAAVALSSGGGGGGGGDDRPRFGSQHNAARQVLNDVNPTSVAQNKEWGGYVYRNADGSYSYTNAVQGNATSVLLPAPSSAAPNGSVTTASYHTHAAFDPRYDNENFSPQDIISDELFGLDGYLATPAGQFKYHNVRNGRVTTLGGPGALATGG